VFATAPILARGFDQFLTLQWDSLTDLLLKLSAPIVLLLVLIELALGLLARYLHSLDVHFQSMAIKQIVSIVMLATLLTMFFSTAMAMFSPDSQVRQFIHSVSPDYRPNH
jgi:type III secretion protein T